MTWLALKAWPWLKKYWKWLLFPIGLFIFIVGWQWRRPVKITSSGLLGHEKVKKVLDEEADKALGEAKKEQDEKIDAIEKEHAATVAKLTKEQREKAKELREDPDKLIDFLMGVGKEIREDS